MRPFSIALFSMSNLQRRWLPTLRSRRSLSSSNCGWGLFSEQDVLACNPGLAQGALPSCLGLAERSCLGSPGLSAALLHFPGSVVSGA